MKLWVDDVRQPPNEEEYDWILSVNEAKDVISEYERYLEILTNLVKATENLIHQPCNARKYLPKYTIEYIDIDHDAGDEASDGGDYIRLLDWLEETGRSYPIHIHSQNPVGVENMRRIIRRNGWKEIL